MVIFLLNDEELFGTPESSKSQGTKKNQRTKRDVCCLVCANRDLQA